MKTIKAHHFRGTAHCNPYPHRLRLPYSSKQTCMDCDGRLAGTFANKKKYSKPCRYVCDTCHEDRDHATFQVLRHHETVAAGECQQLGLFGQDLHTIYKPRRRIRETGRRPRQWEHIHSPR